MSSLRASDDLDDLLYGLAAALRELGQGRIWTALEWLRLVGLARKQLLRGAVACTGGGPRP